jgi:hypothetical protein
MPKAVTKTAEFEYKKAFGKRLKILLKGIGIKNINGVFAAYLGISKTSVSAWITGRRQITLLPLSSVIKFFYDETQNPNAKNFNPLQLFYDSTSEIKKFDLCAECTKKYKQDKEELEKGHTQKIKELEEKAETEKAKLLEEIDRIEKQYAEKFRALQNKFEDANLQSLFEKTLKELKEKNNSNI